MAEDQHESTCREKITNGAGYVGTAGGALLGIGMTSLPAAGQAIGRVMQALEPLTLGAPLGAYGGGLVGKQMGAKKEDGSLLASVAAGAVVGIIFPQAAGAVVGGRIGKSGGDWVGEKIADYICDDVKPKEAANFKVPTATPQPATPAPMRELDQVNPQKRKRQI